MHYEPVNVFSIAPLARMDLSSFHWVRLERELGKIFPQWQGKGGVYRAQTCYSGSSYSRAAFKFGRHVHFALRRKMLKPPLARLPAI